MTRPTALVVAALVVPALVLAALVLLPPDAALRAEATSAPPAAADVQHLQGTWQGVLVGQESAGTITITFRGSSLHFQGLRADQWYDAAFTLQEGTRPRQLRATITGCEVVKDIGTVIGAIFKIENGILSLAGLEDDAKKPASSGDGKPLFKVDGSFNAGAPSISDDSEAFDGNAMFHYRLRKVEPQAKKAGAPQGP